MSSQAVTSALDGAASEALARRLSVHAAPADAGAGADAEPVRPHGMPIEASEFVLRACSNISILTTYPAPCAKDRRKFSEAPAFGVKELKVDAAKGWLREATGTASTFDALSSPWVATCVTALRDKMLQEGQLMLHCSPVEAAAALAL